MVKKNLPADAGDRRDLGLIPGKLPCRRELQFSCLENPHGQRSPAGYSPWGHKSRTRLECLSTHTHSGSYLLINILNKTNFTNDYRGIFIEFILTFLFSYFRYHCPVPKIFYVQLTVGNNEFFGEGKTRQAARHNAAMKALQALQNEPIPEKSAQVGPCGVWQPISNSRPGRLLRRQRNAPLRIEDVSASRREPWIGCGGASAHLCARLDSCVLLGWPCL